MMAEPLRKGVLREFVLDGYAYELLFDGAHREQDADLFHIEMRIPEKLEGTGRPRNHGLASVTACLEASPGPMTLTQIAHALSVSTQVVNTALYHLRQQGRLGSRALTGSSTNGRPFKEYWLLRSGRA